MYYQDKYNLRSNTVDKQMNQTEKKFTNRLYKHLNELEDKEKDKTEMVRTNGDKLTRDYQENHLQTFDSAKKELVDKNFKAYGSEGNISNEEKEGETNVMPGESNVATTDGGKYNKFNYGLGLSNNYTRVKRSPVKGRSDSANNSQFKEKHVDGKDMTQEEYDQQLEERIAEMNHRLFRTKYKVKPKVDTNLQNCYNMYDNNSHNGECRKESPNSALRHNRAFEENIPYYPIKNKFLDAKPMVTQKFSTSRRSSKERLLGNKSVAVNPNLSSGERYSMPKPIENIDFNNEENPKRTINEYEKLQKLNDRTWKDWRSKPHNFYAKNPRVKPQNRPFTGGYD